MQASSTIDFTNILTFVGWLTVRGGRLSVMVVFAVDVYLYYFQLLMALVQSCNDLVCTMVMTQHAKHESS